MKSDMKTNTYPNKVNKLLKHALFSKLGNWLL